jgi:hypothetical protein
MLVELGAARQNFEFVAISQSETIQCNQAAEGVAISRIGE